MKGNKFFFFQISIIVGQILLNGDFGLIAIRWVNRTCCEACLLTRVQSLEPTGQERNSSSKVASSLGVCPFSIKK